MVNARFRIDIRSHGSWERSEGNRWKLRTARTVARRLWSMFLHRIGVRAVENSHIVAALRLRLRRSKRNHPERDDYAARSEEGREGEAADHVQFLRSDNL